MHRTMSPNLFSYLRLTDTPDIDLLGRDCVQLSPFLVLRSWHCWLECWASSAPALASTQKSFDACLDKRKLALLVLTQDAKTVAPGVSWDYQICVELCSSNLCCSTGSLNTHLITSRYLEMLKVIWKILPLQGKKKIHPKWETGATPPSAYIGSVHQQCLVCFHAPCLLRD